MSTTFAKACVTFFSQSDRLPQLSAGCTRVLLGLQVYISPAVFRPTRVDQTLTVSDLPKGDRGKQEQRLAINKSHKSFVLMLKNVLVKVKAVFSLVILIDHNKAM